MTRQSTIEKILLVLNDMKQKADNNLPLNSDHIAATYRVGKAVPVLAKKAGFFQLTEKGWICTKGYFSTSDARKLSEAVNKYGKRHSSKPKIDEVVPPKPMTDEEFVQEFERRGFIIIDGAIYKKISR